MMEAFNSPVIRLFYKFFGKSVNKAAKTIAKLLDNPPDLTLSAFRENKKLSLTHASFNPENAKRLYDITVDLLKI